MRQSNFMKYSTILLNSHPVSIKRKKLTSDIALLQVNILPDFLTVGYKGSTAGQWPVTVTELSVGTVTDCTAI